MCPAQGLLGEEGNLDPHTQAVLDSRSGFS